MNKFQERVQEFSKNRIFMLLCSIVILFVILIFRLFLLQIIHGEEYEQKLTTSILRQVNLPASRGAIYDRYGRPLAVNHVAYSIQIDDSITLDLSNYKSKLVMDFVNYMKQKSLPLADTLPISKSKPYSFEFETVKEEQDWKESIDIPKNMMDSSAEEILTYFENQLNIPSHFSQEEKRSIISFYISVSDRNLMVLSLLKILEENNGSHIKIISKIENRQGIDNFDEILEVSDGIMVARGDLGVEIPMEEVPIRQKEFISKCNKAGKPVITATQMLESMIHSPRPTRAEVSDVANAVYDMTSCVMLSGESAMGEYPVECVQTMVRICEAIEGSLKYWKRFKNKERDYGNEDYEYNLNYSTCSTAMDLCAKAIFAYTDTGRTAKMLAGFMPQCPIYVITANQEVCKQLSMIWNANAILVESKESIDDMIDEGIRIAKEKKYIESGDIVVIAGGASILAGHKHAKLNKTIGGVLKV